MPSSRTVLSPAGKTIEGARSRVFCEGWGFQHCEHYTRLNTDRHRILKAWIAAILWLIVIAIESTNLASSNNTSRILYPLLHFLFGMDLGHFEHLHFYIRKGGHVFGYGLLSVLLFRAWRETLPGLQQRQVDSSVGDSCRARNCCGRQSGRMAPELHSVAHRNTS